MFVKDARINEQDGAYRRGLVLGLTMAEIMVLVLFTLLLALAAVISKKTEELQSKETLVAELLKENPAGVSVTEIVTRIERQRKEIEKLQSDNGQLRKYEEFGKLLSDITHLIKRSKDRDLSADDVVQLVKTEGQAAASLADARAEIARLKPLEEKARQLDNIIAKLGNEGGPTSAVDIEKRLSDADDSMRQTETLKGQVVQLSRQIKSLGKGNDFPSCWVTADGKTESIFEVYITGAGVIVKDRPLANRTKDKQKLPVSSISYDSELTVKSFQDEMRPLFEWSVHNNCRFYVIIRSTVETVPIRIVNAVNQYFYPDSFIKYQPSR